MGKFKEIAIILEDLKRMIPNMKLRYDVYNYSMEEALTAYEILAQKCNNVTMSKSKRYNTERYYYNVYGDVDTADLSILHDALSDGNWVDSASELD